ncbi:type VII secretion target [Mycobacteroides abscessus]|uniref:type VII secretion target n=1 Tax=Mycobacteroides abscessus TaxID=36809 RepID=UPI000C26B4B4|nr:type VII secretion target [Mycobacteroides abscessus]RIR65452.1 hypothetical protein D2E62_12340 [Mycobacteroides abscessus]
MVDNLNVDPDGLRHAAGRSEALAGDMSAPSVAGGGSSSDPTVGAVQAISAHQTSSHADQTAFLSGRAGMLRSGANGYESTDNGSANKITGTM